MDNPCGCALNKGPVWYLKALRARCISISKPVTKQKKLPCDQSLHCIFDFLSRPERYLSQPSSAKLPSTFSSQPVFNLSFFVFNVCDHLVKLMINFIRLQVRVLACQVTLRLTQAVIRLAFECQVLIGHKFTWPARLAYIFGSNQSILSKDENKATRYRRVRGAHS